MAGNLADVIMCAKFQGEIFRGYDFTGGQISHFPIDFRMCLTTVQRDCAACDITSSAACMNPWSVLRWIIAIIQEDQLLQTTYVLEADSLSI